MNKRHKKNLLIMTPILLFAAYLRIYQLETIPYGLITDEVMRGYDAYSLLWTGADSFGKSLPLFLRGFDDYTPALYSYLSVPFIAIFDLSAFSARLASAIVGIFTVALAYQLIRRPFGEIAALAGAFLLAASPWHILASRTGTEWNLLAFGPLLTVCLAYRGLKRPNFLIAAGVAGGLSLYGYAPIKAFLPILLGGFMIFYWRELRYFKKFNLISLSLFMIIASPVYLFSLTPEGASRFNIVFAGKQLAFPAVVFTLVQNYFSYFSPRFFILSEYENERLPIYLVHLKHVGLLSWFELSLIIVGLAKILLSKDKNAWFILYWLLVSPLGINLHDNSPWPTLWLTAIPIPQALAGAGWAGLWSTARMLFPNSFHLSGRAAAGLFTAIILAILSGGIFRHIKTMHTDLFYEYPIYGAKDGRKEAILLMEALKDQYDEVTIPARNLSTSIYLLFYSRYNPAIRHAELANAGQEAWRQIDHYNIGPIEDYVNLPGCHLILTSVGHSDLIRASFPYLITLKQFYLPDGQPNVGLYALPVPPPARVESGIIFDEKIMLQGFAAVTTSPSTTELQAGQSICVILQWQAVNTVDKDYTVFVHLVGPHGSSASPGLWAQHDSPPLHGLKPSSSWAVGEVVQDIHRFSLPEGIVSGEYTVELGLYDPLTGERLTIKSGSEAGDDKLSLMALTVQAKKP